MTTPTTPSSGLDRRHFMKSAAVAGIATAVGLPRASQAAENRSHKLYPMIPDNGVVLFQGDSITDAGRNRGNSEANNAAAMGSGYAWFAAAQLLVDRAGDDIQCFNRGNSGHKVFQLADRWEKDCLSLKPNVLSILIGVNDIWHALNGKYDGTVEIYEKDLMALLKRTLSSLPEVKFVICEPFVLRCGAVSDKWFPEFDHYRAAAKRVAQSYKTIWVPFQSAFDDAVKVAPPNHWAGDGVHPTKNGASLMAHQWLKAVQLGTQA